MAKRIIMNETGAPDVMQLEEVELSSPGESEVQINQTAIGLNYMDVYQRSGYYPMQVPSPLGLEAAGEITAVGAGVDNSNPATSCSIARAGNNGPSTSLSPIPSPTCPGRSASSSPSAS